MTDITNRAYAGTDDLYAIQAAHARWIAKGADSDMHTGDIPHRLFNGFRGRYYLSDVVRIWEHDGEIVAFAIVYPAWDGYDMVLDPRFYDTEIERETEAWAYRVSRRWMDRYRKVEEAVGIDVPAEDTRRRAFLEALGYQDAGYTMNVNRRTLDEIAAPTPPAGFVIRPATGVEEIVQLAAVHASAFKSGWSPELYRDEVMLKPGYDAQREIIVVAPDGRFAAFTIYWLDVVNKIGLFEPVGVHSDFQRRGLGRAIMLHTMHLMREQGMTQAQVANDLDNPAANGLYTALGFKPVFQIHDYRKQRDA